VVVVGDWSLMDERNFATACSLGPGWSAIIASRRAAETLPAAR
jgi:hypothetical protein